MSYSHTIMIIIQKHVSLNTKLGVTEKYATFTVGAALNFIKLVPEWKETTYGKYSAHWYFMYT